MTRILLGAESPGARAAPGPRAWLTRLPAATDT